MTRGSQRLRTALLLSCGLLCIGAVLLTRTASRPARAQTRLGPVVNSITAEMQSLDVPVNRMPARSAQQKTPPDQPPRKTPKRPEDVMRLDPPIDPSTRLEDIRPLNAPTEVKIIAQSPGENHEGKKNAPQAPGTFTLFRNTGLASAPVVADVTLNSFIPIEPSAATNGRVVFYTTNSYAAISGDGGQSFSYLNPFDFFPADGTNDPINGGFGGDQYVYYERTRGLLCWLIQYNPDNTTNRYRLALARSQTDALNNNWYFYDFTPATFGLVTPAGAQGVWMDFPDLAVSDNFLYFTANYFPRVTRAAPPNNCTATCPGSTCPAGCANCTPVACSSLGSIIARLPLTQLAQGVNLGGIFFNDTTHNGLRLTQGARDTMYWGTHNTNAQLRICRWPENGNIVCDDVSHTAYNVGAMIANSPGGTNFAATADSRVQAGWVANGVLGFMWNAAQGGGFTFPHVQVLRFNESNRTLLSQGQVFSNTQAYLYPSVNVNDRGHLGGTMAWGGGTNFPNALAWIADDFNNNTITPLENVTFATGTAGPCDPNFAPPGGGCYNRWGDYFSTRVHSPNGNTWLGTGFVLNGANGVTRDPRYVWFGRERDTPPPTNVIFVSLANTTGYEDGTLFHPYNTIGEAHFAALPGDVISIVPGNYNEQLRLNRASQLERLGTTGTVKIGQP